MCKEKIHHTATPPPAGWLDPGFKFVHAKFWPPPSKYLWNCDSSDQAHFFPNLLSAFFFFVEPLPIVTSGSCCLPAVCRQEWHPLWSCAAVTHLLQGSTAVHSNILFSQRLLWQAVIGVSASLSSAHRRQRFSSDLISKAFWARELQRRWFFCLFWANLSRWLDVKFTDYSPYSEIRCWWWWRLNIPFKILVWTWSDSLHQLMVALISGWTVILNKVRWVH